MSTSTEPAPADARIRPQEPDDPTIWEVDDALWARIAPLVASTKVRKKPGRPRRDDRVLVNGLIWLARTGAQWTALPARYGPKSTCHARFQEWVASGVFAQLWAVLLEAYDDQLGLDWQWQAADGCLVKAPLGKRGLSVRRRRRGATPPIAASAAPSATC
jgi:putative transposase